MSRSFQDRQELTLPAPAITAPAITAPSPACGCTRSASYWTSLTSWQGSTKASGRYDSHLLVPIATPDDI